MPTVVVVSLVVGLVLGFGLASKAGPAAVLSAPSPNASLPTVRPAQARTDPTPVELPPSRGLTFVQAQAVLKLAAVGSDSPSAVVSAQITRYGQVASGALPADRWVWAFIVRGVFDQAGCTAGQPSAEPCPPTGATELAVFDYQTGEFLEDRIPAYP